MATWEGIDSGDIPAGANPDPLRYGSAWAQAPEGGYKTLDASGQPTYSAAPDFNEMLNHALVGYQQQYGAPLNRPWNSDAEASGFGNSILGQYQNALSQWNMMSGQNAQPTVSGLGDFPTSQYAASLPAMQKGSGSMIVNALHDPAVLGMGALATAGALGVGLGGAEGAAGLGDTALLNQAYAIPGEVTSASFGAGAGAGSLIGGGAAAGGLEEGADLLSRYAIPGEVTSGSFGADAGAGSLISGAAPSAFSLSSFLQNPTGSLSKLFGASGANDNNGIFGGNPVGSALSIGSGIYGLYNQNELRKKALEAMQISDPWGTSGGRAGASDALKQFLADPSGAMKGDPSYALRIQAAQRATGMYGQDSGKMAVAAADASTSWYNDRLQQLGGLAGTQFNPAGAAQLGLSGMESANKLAGDSLASIGYGSTGGGQGIPPAMQQALMLRMIQMGMGGGTAQ